ncbi:MAG: GFA family protein [Hyphomicrobiaceae bacterium]
MAPSGTASAGEEAPHDGNGPVSGEGGPRNAGRTLTGGCQCGAVRYGITGPIFDAQICHCRMCQRAFGSYFAPLGAVATADIAWLSAPPQLYRSSPAAERGFCARCGTPLTFQYLHEPGEISIALGSLDDPEAAPPLTQYGIESRLSFFAALHALPGETTEESTPAELLTRIRQKGADRHDGEA